MNAGSPLAAQLTALVKHSVSTKQRLSQSGQLRARRALLLSTVLYCTVVLADRLIDDESDVAGMIDAAGVHIMILAIEF
jgi:hypothetical protein